MGLGNVRKMRENALNWYLEKKLSFWGKINLLLQIFDFLVFFHFL